MLKYDVEQQRRMAFYRMLILIAVMIAAGRIASVLSREGDTAFQSANDRSRWCTIASLVEHGTYEIDQQIAIRGERNRQPWNTIDKVRHRGADGQLHYYSSKPPLYTTLLAGIYAVVERASGMTMTDQPIYVPRIMLALVNLPMYAVMCWFTILVIERLGVGEWPRRIAAMSMCFGTMLLPFTITLNNHLPAAMATAIVMYLYLLTAHELRDEFNGGIHAVSRWAWMGGGLAAGFAAANELPALSMLALWTVMLAVLDWKSLIWFALGVAIIACGFFGTNYLAHDSFRPPYAHRGDGEPITTLAAANEPAAADVKAALIETAQIQPEQSVVLQRSGEAGRWVAQTDDDRLFAVTSLTPTSDSTAARAAQWQIRQWDDWYDYPGSYWTDGQRRGVDLGEPSRLAYLFQITIGHHGIFSLTPIWFLLPVGVVCSLAYGQRDFRIFVMAVMLATVVCIIFYVMRPQIDRNYGGVSCCFRWMLWFIPLWTVICIPALNECGETPRARLMTNALLAAGVFSAATALHSPWQSPWIYRFWSFLGWLG
tara:strand:- start:20323 stop:21945 length:1623 start_codon:yes stop_codon:yes gene_type:complete